MPTGHRWVFYDPSNGDTWEMQINPNQMTSPHLAKGLQPMARNATMPGYHHGGMGRVFIPKRTPQELTFQGVIRSRMQLYDLNVWRGKRNKVHLTDDLGRTWQVLISGIRFEEQRPTPRNKWRYTYTLSCMLYGTV